MKKNKIIWIVFTIFFGSWGWGQNTTSDPENIDVRYLYTPYPDEKKVHDVLFPLVIPYLQTVVSSYNQLLVHQDNKVHQVFISELFRSRIQQRQSHFYYITQGKGLIDFFQLYDKYNDQFAVQFLHIVMPVFATPQATKKLLGTLNKSLDRALKNPFLLVGREYVSDYLLKRLNVKKIEDFSSSDESIQEVARDASSYYDLDKDFIIAVKDALKSKIQQNYRVSSEIANISAQSNFNYLLASEIFRLIQPELKRQGDNLLNHPIVGRELKQWFKTAPAFSQHSIIGVHDKDLDNLAPFLNSGKKFQFALDLGMSANQDEQGNEVWNPENPNNQLDILNQALLNYPQFKSGDYYLTLVPDKIIVSPYEKAVHIELIVSKIPVSPSQLPTKNKEDRTTIDFGAPTQEPSVSSSVTEDANMEKNFELPNNDSQSTTGKSRVLNVKTYSQILGDTYKGQNKGFEDQETPPLLDDIEPKENIPHPEKTDNSLDNSSELAENDEDLDTEIDQTL